MSNKPSPLPDYSWIEIYSPAVDSSLYIKGQFGPGEVKQSGGGGGWKSVPRPLRRPLTPYLGPQDSFTYEIPIMFNGWRKGNSMVPQLKTLEKMAGILQPGDPTPPLLIINAQGSLMHDVYHEPGNRWVIPETPTIDSQALDRDGNVVQFFATVQFMIYTADDRLARAKQVSKAHYAVARAGDTFNRVAARELKKHGGARWGNRLAQLNHARDGAVKLKVGVLVRLPTPDQIKSWERSPRR